LVGHHDDAGSAAEVVEAEGDGAAEAVGAGVADGAEGGDFFAFGLEDGPGGVGGSVLDDEDFVGDGVEVELEVEVLDGGGDAAFFVAGWDDDGEVGGHFGKVERQGRFAEEIEVSKLEPRRAWMARSLIQDFESKRF